MLIHKMKLDDNMAVLDINSGAVHLVDEIIYDVLDVFNGENDEETLRAFAGRYSEEDIREVLAELHELKDEGLEQKSLTDPDSRRMKNNGSLDICYNVQSVVDAKNHFVVDISTTNDINDQNQLYTMAQKASELLEKESSTVLADTGYYNGTEIKNCVDAGMNVFIKKAKANNATKDNEFRKEKLI